MHYGNILCDVSG